MKKIEALYSRQFSKCQMLDKSSKAKIVSAISKSLESISLDLFMGTVYIYQQIGDLTTEPVACIFRFDITQGYGDNELACKLRERLKESLDIRARIEIAKFAGVSAKQLKILIAQLPRGFRPVVSMLVMDEDPAERLFLSMVSTHVDQFNKEAVLLPIARVLSGAEGYIKD